jgi:hypothetical protein
VVEEEERLLLEPPEEEEALVGSKPTLLFRYLMETIL